MSNYPPSYHTAIRLLIAHGASNPAYSKVIRDNLAAALRWLRKYHGRERAINERYHIAYICGHLPDRRVKP